MRYFVLALMMAACTHDEHHIEASWTIERLGPALEREPIGCPDGWNTAQLVAIDPAQPDVRHVDEFPCADGAGVSAYLPAESYITWVEILAGEKIVASSLEEPVSVTSFNPISISEIYVNAGYVEASWDACSGPDDGSLGVRLDVGSSTTWTSCHAGRVGSPPLPPGSYPVAFRTETIAQTLDHVEVATANRVTHLPGF
ncbi:hypothetical protein BH11MYX1_BH11MYX1_48620 [soil metagenome]